MNSEIRLLIAKIREAQMRHRDWQYECEKSPDFVSEGRKKAAFKSNKALRDIVGEEISVETLRAFAALADEIEREEVIIDTRAPQNGGGE